MGRNNNRKHEKSTMQKNDNQFTELEKLNPTNLKDVRRKRPFKQKQKIKKKNTKKGRIIVRNLPFKTTEDLFRKHFEQFGTITDIKLLKKPDGKLVGCGFIQYDYAKNAAKAIYHLSGKPFLGREIICDWALGKDTYIKNMQEAYQKEIGNKQNHVIEIKDEKDLGDELPVIKTESDSLVNPIIDESIIKIEDEFDHKIKEEFTDENDPKTDNSLNETKEESSDDESVSKNSDDDDSEIDDSDVKKVKREKEMKNEIEAKKPKVVSNDVTEGKTVFIRNLPFSVTNKELQECMLQFGPVYYALVCVDRLTEFSKGTGFVKFMNKEDADKCLLPETEVILEGNVLEFQKALSKTELDKKYEKPDTKSDSRNLYLIKEGVIIAGSKAAKGVSASDMAKRLEIERWKKQILKNLNMFVSLYRLIIHNLPFDYDDNKLKQLVAKHASRTAVIKKVVVMRDMKNFDDEGKPISKGFGFVSFSKHEDALQVLRSLNNNPNVFTPGKRPIVAFSIENKSVINAKEKRMLKSRLNNPTCKDFDPTLKKKEDEAASSVGAQIPAKEFSGITATPGMSTKMRSKHNLTTQAKLHKENLMQEKRRMKLTRKSIKKKKQDYLKQVKKQKGKKNKEDDNFSKLVNKYTKTNLDDTTQKKKRKWYES